MQAWNIGTRNRASPHDSRMPDSGSGELDVASAFFGVLIVVAAASALGIVGWLLAFGMSLLAH